MKEAVLLLWLAKVCLIEGYSSGAATGACESMIPGHGASPQNSPVPYSLTPGEQIVEAGKVLNLTLLATGTDLIKGFMVQAYISGSGTRTGTFITTGSNNVKSMKCGYDNSAATHKDSNEKNNIVLAWRAPIDAAGKTIEFNFSVVKDFGTYWTKKTATNTLTILNSQDGQSSTVAAEPEVEPEVEAEAEDAAAEDAAAEGAAAEGAEPKEDLPEAYKGCNEQRGCFGTKFGSSETETCIDSGTCKIMVSYQYNPDAKQYNFQLHLKSSDTNQYMAVALSKDDKMGGDLVISCQASAGSQPQVSYNNGRSNSEAETESNLINEAVATKEVDGISSCQFNLPEKIKVLSPIEDEFNLAEDLHLLLATGAITNEKLSHHTSRLASKAPVSLASVQKVEIGGDSGLDQVHAALMILAWMGSAASGMLLARYYKKTWRDVRPCDKDLWFRLHQLFMGSTVLLTFAGFIIIVSEHGKAPLAWDSIKNNPHPVFGLICFITTLIQPLMAILRPNPESDSRWIFNWAHWAFGNLAFLFAILAIFFGLEYAQIGTPKEAGYVMITYCVIHFLVHFALTFHRCFVQKSNKIQEINSDEIQDEPGSNLRKAIAFLYLGLVWIFALVILGWVIHMKVSIGGNGHDHHH